MDDTKTKRIIGNPKLLISLLQNRLFNLISHAI